MDPVYSRDAYLQPLLSQYWAEHQAEIEQMFPMPSFPWKEAGVAAAILLILGGLFGGE